MSFNDLLQYNHNALKKAQKGYLYNFRLPKVKVISENDTHHNILTSRIAELEETLQEQTAQIGK